MSDVRLQPHERAARVIAKALEGLTEADRERALGAALGRSATVTRLARLEMAAEAAAMRVQSYGAPLDAARILEKGLR